MIYIYVDNDERKYLQATAQCVSDRQSFRLMQKNQPVDADATGVFSGNPEVLKTWTDAGVPEYSLDSRLPASEEQVDGDRPAPKAKRSRAASRRGDDE